MTTSVIDSQFPHSSSPAEPTAVAASGATAPRPPWNLAQRIGFRFAFVFFILYSFPFPITTLYSIPWVNKYVGIGMDFLFGWYWKFWNWFTPWVGYHVIHLNYEVKPQQMSGSGDQMYNYVHLLSLVLITLAVTLVWSVLDRKRANYRALHDWLRVYVRFVLAFSMLSYGGQKVLPVQMSRPMLARLMAPLGDLAGMGMAWTFMGSSTLYTVFAGMGEFVAGLLLFFRRTTTLGALLAFAVMANVAMMNYGYDIPVKLYSTYLCLLAVFLILPDLRRLADVIVFNRMVPPADRRPVLPGRKGVIFRSIAKLFAIVVAGVLPMKQNLAYYRMPFGNGGTHPSLYGAYTVETFVRGGDTVAAGTDPSRWRQAIVDWGGGVFNGKAYPSLTVRLTNDLSRYYKLTIDSVGTRVKLSYDPNTTAPYPYRDGDFRYTKTDSTYLDLDGVLEQDTVHIRLRRRHFYIQQGFHWVNEFPVQSDPNAQR